MNPGIDNSAESGAPRDGHTRKSVDSRSSVAVFVVGPGRSGTSVLTRGLQALGVDLGETFKSANKKNPTGFFEDRDLLRIGKQARATLGLRAESVALVGADDWQMPDLEPLRDKAIEVIESRFANKPLWGFKYSQTLRYLPFWLPVLSGAGVQLAFVVAIRNPISVARSRAKLDALRGRQEKSDLEWLVNVVPYFRELAQHRFVVVDYDLLLADPKKQLTRVTQALAIPQSASVTDGIQAFSDEFLDPSLQHNRASGTDLEGSRIVNELTRDAYRWLKKLASDEIRQDDEEFWKHWSEVERQLMLMAPALRHVDYLENRVRYTSNPLRETLRRRKQDRLRAG